MTAALRLILRDRELAEECARRGLAAIHSRHTCAHRVDQLFDILGHTRAAGPSRTVPSPQQNVLTS
jgi:hypothetical protein